MCQVNNNSSNFNVDDTTCFKLGLLNTRSVCNKTVPVSTYLKTHRLDIFGLTETWLRSDSGSDSILAALVPDDYTIVHKARPRSRGGGIALILHKSLKYKIISLPPSESFESLCLDVSTNTMALRVYLIYRPPSLSQRDFLSDVADILEDMGLMSMSAYLMGDLNLHLDNTSNKSAMEFLTLVSNANLKQLVSGPTHKSGHTLDGVVTNCGHRVSECAVDCVTISDHFPIRVNMSFTRVPSIPKYVMARSIRKIDHAVFRIELIKKLTQIKSADTSVELISGLESSFTGVLDTCAPLKRVNTNYKTQSKWYSDEIREKKKVVRKHEKSWRKTGDERERFLYKRGYEELCLMISNAKSAYLKTEIESSKGDSKRLHKVLGSIIKPKYAKLYPTADSVDLLCERFSAFFEDKIRLLRESIDEEILTIDGGSLRNWIKHCRNTPGFDHFHDVDSSLVKKLIMSMKSKSCKLDPLPTVLLKQHIDTIAPVLADLFNLMFAECHIPLCLKLALIIPLLKKVGLDPEVLKNFRPVSNLAFISKLFEKTMIFQLMPYLKSSDLLELLQSAYKVGHSTETVLLKLHNDILMNVDSGHPVLLVLLDLSSAFDTIDHTILLDRLKDYYGINGDALKLFKSYLDDRWQSVYIDDHQSQPRRLSCGVPQGSGLGPLLFTLYVQPVCDLLRSKGINFHLYADDVQLYINCSSYKHEDILQAVLELEEAIELIGKWMRQNKLRLNDEKTEVMLFGDKRCIDPLSLNILVRVGYQSIPLKDVVKYLGVYIDSSLRLEKHFNGLIQQSFSCLTNLFKIRSYLDINGAKTLVQSLIMSRLDYCNSIFTSLPEKNLDRLERVLNASARFIFKLEKGTPTTTYKIQLHWLPVKKRCEFKLLTFVHKCIYDTNSPKYLKDLLGQVYHQTDLRSNHNRSLIQPKTSLVSIGNRSFYASGPCHWNRLPPRIRQTETLKSFKKYVKTSLFAKCYEQYL